MEFKVLEALKSDQGIVAQADGIAAGVITAMGATTKDLGTEIKFAVGGAFICLGSEVISNALGIVGLDVSSDTIDAVGGAMILGAAASATNKVIDNFAKVEEESTEKPKLVKKKAKPKVKVIEETEETEEVEEVEMVEK